MFEEDGELVQESDPEPENSWKDSRLLEAPERLGQDRGLETSLDSCLPTSV